jgi:hypothetical protein
MHELRSRLRKARRFSDLPNEELDRVGNWFAPTHLQIVARQVDCHTIREGNEAGRAFSVGDPAYLPATRVFISSKDTCLLCQ